MFPDAPIPELPKNKNAGLFCRDCAHRQRWQCNSMIIQYCGVRSSNRTFNGLLKIKAKNDACDLFESK